VTPRWRLYLFFIGLALVGSFLRAVYPYSAPLHDLAHALFDAIAVAGVLGFCIELAAQRRLIGEVATELLGRIAGRHLPTSLQHTMEGIVLNANLVMRDYRRTYRFATRDDGHVDIESDVVYDVVNFGPRSQPYTPKMSAHSTHRDQLVRRIVISQSRSS
jgi:hypothetical protein